MDAPMAGRGAETPQRFTKMTSLEPTTANVNNTKSRH